MTEHTDPPHPPSPSSRRTPVCGEAAFEDQHEQRLQHTEIAPHTVASALETIAGLIRQRDMLTRLLGEALRENERLAWELRVARGEITVREDRDETDFLDRR